MRIYRFQGEKTLTELVRKLYEIDRKGLTVANVAKQLANANPHLDLASKSFGKKIPIGTLIVTPDIDGAHYTAATMPLRHDVVDALPTDKLIDEVGAAIVSALERESERLRESLHTVETVIGELPDTEAAAEFEKTRAAMDEQFGKLDDEKRTIAYTVEKAKEVLYRQRELLKQR